MTNVKIQVKKIYKSQGVNKNNKPYTLLKLMDDKKVYYSSFKPDKIDKLNEIKEGMSVLLDVEKSNQLGYYNITKVIAFSANPASIQERGNPSVTTANDPLKEKLAKAIEEPDVQIDALNQVSDNLKDAIDIVRDKMKLDENTSLTPYVNLIVENQHELFALQISKEIANSKLRNMGLIR